MLDLNDLFHNRHNDKVSHFCTKLTLISCSFLLTLCYFDGIKTKGE